MGQHWEAYNAFTDGLHNALLFNLELTSEVLALLRPLFPGGWTTLPANIDDYDAASLANTAANALLRSGQVNEAAEVYVCALRTNLRGEHWGGAEVNLANISLTLGDNNHPAAHERCLRLLLRLAEARGYKASLFHARRLWFTHLASLGEWERAEAMWQLLDPMGREWPRSLYRPGQAEIDRCYARFWRGDLREEDLVVPEELARSGRNRGGLRDLLSLRGAWLMKDGQHARAAPILSEGVRMAREVGETDLNAEAQLALAKLHLGQLPHPRHAAEQLTAATAIPHRALAQLWLAIGDGEQARKHALAAYTKAWADGEPYVYRYELNSARDLLEQLGVEVPDLPPYDPANDEPFPWEAEVEAAIEKIRADNDSDDDDDDEDA
jgi:tetratricopeptide (TPR) repeat protein